MGRVRVMASRQEHSSITSPRNTVFTLFLALCWLKPQGHYALDEHLKPELYHTVLVSSLLPFDDQSSCNNLVPSSTTSGPSKRKASLRVANRYGACSLGPRGANEAKTNMAAEILSHDRSRVKSIKARLDSFNSNKDLLLTSKKGDRNSGRSKSDKKTTNLPAQRGTALGSGNYLVDIGIGTPSKQFSMIFDTGSDFTWTQCEPCVSYCYKQKQPIFDPSKSTTYSNISCSTPLCSELKSATSVSPSCTSSTCVYGIQYGDQSFSVGFFAKETITLSGSDVLENIPFGCGQKNQGLFGTTAGLIGLGRHPLSIVSQTAQKYGQVFSYCLPGSRSTSRGGYLAFGSSGLPANLRYTPFSTSEDLFYKIKIIGISVGGLPVPITATVLKSDGETIIDSGTVITRLPASIYNPMRDTFKKHMANYKLVSAFSILDTCYDFSNLTSVNVPIISFYFSGRNVKVDLVASGILFPVNGASQVCLAFAEDDSVNIFGNTQQQTLEVVYNVAGGKIGFAPNACG